MAAVIRELAENPDVHQPLPPPRELLLDRGASFVAYLDGSVVAAAYAAYTRWGLLLFRGATAPEARAAVPTAPSSQRVRARCGTPALVVLARLMSRPILERLGFAPVARVARLLDVPE